MATPSSVLSRLSLVQYVGLGLVATIAYACYRVVYELYISPLAKFPGPKLAAVTRAYELYHDIVLSGQYTFKIRDLHAQYGRSETAGRGRNPRLLPTANRRQVPSSASRRSSSTSVTQHSSKSFMLAHPAERATNGTAMSKASAQTRLRSQRPTTATTVCDAAFSNPSSRSSASTACRAYSGAWPRSCALDSKMPAPKGVLCLCGLLSAR